MYVILKNSKEKENVLVVGMLFVFTTKLDCRIVAYWLASSNLCRRVLRRS